MPTAFRQMCTLHIEQVWTCLSGTAPGESQCGWQGLELGSPQVKKFEHVQGQAPMWMTKGIKSSDHMGTPCEQTDWQTDRQDWKHYFQTTSLTEIRKELRRYHPKMTPVTTFFASPSISTIKLCDFSYHSFLVILFVHKSYKVRSKTRCNAIRFTVSTITLQRRALPLPLRPKRTWEFHEASFCLSTDLRSCF